jgi:hypothetical protein
VGIHYFNWRHGQSVKKKAGDHAEVSAAPAATGSEKIGIMVLVDAPELYMAFAVDGKDLDCRKPIDGEAVQSREHAITASADVAPGPHLVAAAAGNGYTTALVQVDVHFAQLLPWAYAITRSVAGKADTLQQAKVQDRTARIVDHEVLVAVTSAADGGSHPCVDNALQSFGCLLGGFAQFDLGGRFGLVAIPAQVAASAQHWVARIGAGNLDGHR